MLDLVRLWIDHLVIDRCPEQVKQVREHNDQSGQHEKNHRRMRNLVPHRFDGVEQLLQKRLWRRSLDDRDDAPLLTHAPSPCLPWFATANYAAADQNSLMRALLSMMIGQHLGDDDRDAFTGGNVQELVWTVCVRVRAEDASDDELRLRKLLPEHGHEGDRAALAHISRRRAEGGL